MGISWELPLRSLDGGFVTWYLDFIVLGVQKCRWKLRDDKNRCIGVH